MLKCLFVPYTVSIEHEHFFGLHVSEDQVLVEHVDSPEHLGGNDVCLNLLQVLNVNEDASHITEVVYFMEGNLFSVGEELSMEGEIVRDCDLAGK